VNVYQRLRAALGGALQSLMGDVEVVRIFTGRRGAAGVYVDQDTALKNATVWACITYLSRTVAQLPWRVMVDRPRGAARAPSHPVDYLIHRRPNAEMSSFTWRETMVGWACRYGNAVAEIVTDGRGIPIALWPLHPSRVTFERDDQTGELLYNVRGPGGEQVILMPEQVFHLRGFGEGAVGLDVISYAAESLGWAQATELFGATYFGNGIQPSGMIAMPQGVKMTPAAKAELERELEDKHRGASRKHRIIVTDQGMDFKKFSETPENAQFIETRQHQIEEICRWFGVPPHKVMHLLRSTFSNIEHQSIEVVVDSITPWVLRVEQEADFKFFGQNRQGLFTKMDLKGLLRGDFKSRQEGLQIMRRNGVINANQWCRLEDMDEIGPQGDLYIVEGNMTTLERLAMPPEPVQTPARTEQVDAEDEPDESPVGRVRRQAARALMH
jgi:HK97 family phage portal protein